MRAKTPSPPAGAIVRPPRRLFSSPRKVRSSFWSLPGARFGLLPLLGAATSTALPPLYILPALVIGFSGLLLAVRASRSLTGAFTAGWTFGFGYFLVGMYWVGNSFLVDEARYGWLAVPAVIGLSAVLAIFPALAAAGTRLLSHRGIGNLVSLAVAWTALEWLRGTVLTGFPWNLIGSVWTVSDQTLQGAALVGVYGLSLMTVLAAASPAAVSWSMSIRRPGRWWPLCLLVFVPFGLWLAGELRLQAVVPPGGESLRLRLVQGNVPQAMKWDPTARERIVRRYVSMSVRDRPSDIALLIWPETAVPVDLVNDQRWRRAVTAAVPRGGVLLTGAMGRPGDAVADRGPRNSLLALSAAGEVIGVYDKVRLVPFGEYMPLRSLLPLSKLTEGRRDFVPGSGPATLAVAGVRPFQPLICYEAIFPGWTPDDDAGRPQWLLNITNDAWFGASTGPYQHFQMARTRAVERGLPLVRAANTGISAVVDPLGRVTAQLGLGETGVLDAAVPARLAAGTPYDRYGEGIVLMLAGVVLATSIFVGRKRRKPRKFGKR